MINMKAFLAGMALAGVALLSPLASAQTQPLMGDLVLGKADAPVTVIEYASFTCPHCAAFHAETYPKLKDSYIKDGKVKFIFRDFPLDEPALRASMLARCAGADRFYSFVEILFSQQLNWARASDPVQALGQLAKLGGIGEAEFRACMTNKQLEEAVLKNRLQGANEYKVNSTPSFLIDGQLQSGALAFADFEKLILARLPRQAAAPTSAQPAAGAVQAPSSPAGAVPGDAGKKADQTPLLIGGGIVVVVLAGAALWYFRRRKSA